MPDISISQTNAEPRLVDLLFGAKCVSRGLALAGVAAARLECAMGFRPGLGWLESSFPWLSWVVLRIGQGDKGSVVELF